MFFVLLIAMGLFNAPEGSPDTGASEGGNSPDGTGDSGSLNSLDDALVSEDTEKKPEQPARSDTTETNKGQPEKLLAGKYKNVEELEKAVLEAQNKITELGQENSLLRKPPEQKQPPIDEWVDLSDEQLETLKTNDPDAYSWYLSEKDNRRIKAEVDKAINPLLEKLKPLDQLTKERNIQAFQIREEKIGMQTTKMFGDEFDQLEKFRTVPENIQDLWPSIPAPIQDAILFHHEKGSPAYAHQLLLQQIQVHNVMTARDKRSRSISPDPGGFGSRGSKDSASTLDEAGDLAAIELGMK
ncbi:MAG: hypothetical protein PHQ91_12345 [Thermoanaerobaculaceae bacterium]|nr:hypothetical protein [Thermoanaerobaculaceae bacterium]